MKGKVRSCVFCNEKNFKDRIVAENDDWYVIATLGQITDSGYVLLIPKIHISCIRSVKYLGIKAKQSFLDMVERTVFAIAKEYNSSVTMFEHGKVGQTVGHAHLHFFPANIDITKRVRSDFPNSRIEEVDIPFFKEDKPYLMWTEKHFNKIFLCWNPPAEPQYLRLVVADILGRPERGDWKQMDEDLDKNLIKETIHRLKKYY